MRPHTYKSVGPDSPLAHMQNCSRFARLRNQLEKRTGRPNWSSLQGASFCQSSSPLRRVSTARTTRSDYLSFGRLASGWRTPEGPDGYTVASVAKRITDAAESTRAPDKGVELPSAVVVVRAHALAAYISISECYTVSTHRDAILKLCDAAEAAAEVARAGLTSQVVLDVGVAMREVARRLDADLSAYAWLEPLLSGVSDCKAHWDVGTFFSPNVEGMLIYWTSSPFRRQSAFRKRRSG